MALDNEVNLTVSQAIIDEMADVLARKFDASPDDVAEAKAILAGAARTVTPSVRLAIIKEDPTDNKILECAVSGGSDFIVSGDKDLLRLGHYDSISIVNVAKFLDVMRGEQRER